MVNTWSKPIEIGQTMNADGSYMSEEEDLCMVAPVSKIKDPSDVEEALEDSPMIEVEDYSDTEDNSSGPGDYSDPEYYFAEDYSDPKILVSQGPQTRLFWNLKDNPIPPGADLGIIYRKIKLALHRMGFHGFLHIWAYGGTLNYTERELDDAEMLHKPSPTPYGCTIAGQMSVDILSQVDSFCLHDSVFLVIANQTPELNRVLERMQSRFDQTVLIIHPQVDLFESAASVCEHTVFLGGRKTRPQTLSSELFQPVEVVEAGVFWDARDCPFPDTWSADSIYDRIRFFFTTEYRLVDNVSVWALLDEKKQSSDEFLGPRTWDSRIHFQPGADNRVARHERMLNDILLWSIDHWRPAHLIVAGKINMEMYNVLGRLEHRGYSVLIIRPEKDPSYHHPRWPLNLMDEAYMFGFVPRSDSGKRKAESLA